MPTAHSAPRVAIVHDYLTQRGGAERVVLSMLRAFPDAQLITSCYAPDGTFDGFRDHDIRTMWLNRVTALRTDPRRAFPLLARAFSGYRVRDADVVLCSSSGFAHGIRATAPKVVYCHNPARWLYQPDDYFARLAPPARAVAARVLGAQRGWDQRAAASAGAYVVNSTTVRERVRRVYGRTARVLPPPSTVDPAAPRTPIEAIRPGFLLVVGRRRGYKNVAAAAEAVAAMPGERLVVVGGLPERGTGRYAREWPPNIVDVGRVSDAQLRWLYASADALLAVSHEDFGLTPVEAYGFGTPTLALRAGGYLDTTRPGVSGLWIEEPTAAAVRAAIRGFRAHGPFDPAVITDHARRWREDRFVAGLREEVARALGSDRKKDEKEYPDLLPQQPGGNKDDIDPLSPERVR